MRVVRSRPGLKLLKYVLAVLTWSLVIPVTAVLMELPVPGWLLLAPAILLALLVLLDFIWGRKVPQVNIERQAPHSLSVNSVNRISVVLSNSSHRDFTIGFCELLPSDWSLQQQAAEGVALELKADEQTRYHYQVIPHTRGGASIDGCELRMLSSLGFWQFDWFYPLVTEHKVYPSFASISDLSGLNGSANLNFQGIKRINRRGTGMDFMQLRDYREGESLKLVDWAATSKFRKLIAKDYQEEKNQNLVIMLDAGQRMCVQDDDASYFDYALNAVLMLSYTALKNGDVVSFQSFGRDSRWLSGLRGADNIPRILNHFYDLYPQHVATDYLKAARELLLQNAKRSLVLFVSCLRDEDFSDLLAAVELLKRRHLIAVISISEPVYKHIEQGKVSQLDEALLYASNQYLKQSIALNIEKLKKQGVICLQSAAEQLTPQVINTYLSVKKSGLL